MRKIIQIAVDSATDTSCAILYALCDDGTLWSRLSLHGRKWELKEGVPQPDEEEEEEVIF